MSVSNENKWMSRVKCSPEERLVFLRQLSIMFDAGVPIVQALDTLGNNHYNERFAEAVQEMSKKVGEGFLFSRTLQFFPKLFNPVHVAMAETGERTGTLAESLHTVSDWGERDLRLFRDVKGALTYPVVVLTVAFALTMLLFLTVVPGFVSMFEEQRMELPTLTKLVVAFTNFVTQPGSWIIGTAACILLYLEFRRILRTPKGALSVYRSVLLIPGVGSLLVTATSARYSGVLGTLLNSGLDLLTALKLSGQASGSPMFREDYKRLQEDIQDGLSLATGYSNRPDIYPPLLCEMTAVGEETSRLAQSLVESSNFFNLKASSQIEALSAALEPLLLTFVSVLVGTILLAIILPLYGFLNQLGL